MFLNKYRNHKNFPRRGGLVLLRRGNKGQALVLLAISFFALLAFVGLLTDVGSIYVAHTQLQRAIDAAAVAAANNIKYPPGVESTDEMVIYNARKQNITEAAREMLKMHDITGISDLTVYLCSDPKKLGLILPANFAAMCPTSSQPQRKLAYVDATQQSPVYFLQLFGVESFPLHASAVGEAAAVDVVLVFDTSESMGAESPGYSNPNDFDPASCNAADTCRPLRDAKVAAQGLIAKLFDDYDQVGIVTFSYDARLNFALSTDLDAASDAITHVSLHDDPAGVKVVWTNDSPWCGSRNFNPINPEDRDGNGEDPDPECTDAYVNLPADCSSASPVFQLGDNTPDMWDDETGEACDDDDLLDAFDWNENGIWGAADAALPEPIDHDYEIAANKNPTAGRYEDTSLISTCSGCGIRLATEELKDRGRKDAVWVIVFLSDGVANLSDFPTTNPAIPTSFRYGFCGSDPSVALWPTNCIDRQCPATGDAYWEGKCAQIKARYPTIPDSDGRFCIDADEDECPPDTTYTTTSGPYSVEDYAMDMLDRAALFYVSEEKPDEPTGENIVVFAIGLGIAAEKGEPLLRYMANVGGDGSRDNDPCDGIPAKQTCGNYYFAPNASFLAQIFENIAGRIFTKISR